MMPEKITSSENRIKMTEKKNNNFFSGFSVTLQESSSSFLSSLFPR